MKTLKGQLRERVLLAGTRYESKDMVCCACLAIVPDGKSCQHCTAREEKKKDNLQKFITSKQVERQVLGLPKRRIGRPKRIQTDTLGILPVTKRPRGRPKKASSLAQDNTLRKRRGRPKGSKDKTPRTRRRGKHVAKK